MYIFAGRVWEALQGFCVGSARALGGIGRGPGSSSGADLDGSGRFLMTSEEVWALLDGSGQRWTALDGLGSFEWHLELARSLPIVENHVPTIDGKHILLSQCFASPKRVRSRKS